MHAVVPIHQSDCSSLLQFFEVIFCLVTHLHNLYIVLDVRSFHFSGIKYMDSNFASFLEQFQHTIK